ncbi:hypothetical protein ACTFIY_000982 [Dictyostelium cf. discoideum]
MSNINFKFTINDVLLNQESLEKNKKYSCPICYEFIYKKSIYQCKSGHHACQECWEKSLKNKKECMICRSELNSINDLSRCLVIEQFFSNEECYCINSYTYKTLANKFLNDKLKKKLIKDQIDGWCNEIVRFKSSQEHEEQCGFKLIICSYCMNYVQKNRVKYHQDRECPKYIIDCLNGCSMKIKREDYQKHIDNDCSNTVIFCKYYEQGCKVKMKRSELPHHLGNENHQIYMGLLIDKLNLMVTKYEEHLVSVKENNEKLLKILNAGEFSNIYKNIWIIPNFSNSLDLIIGYKYSPKFSIVSNEFFISIIVNQSDMSIYLNNIYDKKPVTVEYSLKLVNVNEDKSILHKENKKVFKDSGTKFGHDFLKKREMNKNYGWLNNDGELTMEIYVKVINEIQPLKS